MAGLFEHQLLKVKNFRKVTASSGSPNTCVFCSSWVVHKNQRPNHDPYSPNPHMSVQCFKSVIRTANVIFAKRPAIVFTIRNPNGQHNLYQKTSKLLFCLLRFYGLCCRNGRKILTRKLRPWIKRQRSTSAI